MQTSRRGRLWLGRCWTQAFMTASLCSLESIAVLTASPVCSVWKVTCYCVCLQDGDYKRPTTALNAISIIVTRRGIIYAVVKECHYKLCLKP